MSTPLVIAVTGAAGQIGYSLLFRIASGALAELTAPSNCACSRSNRLAALEASSWSSTTAPSRSCAA